MRRAALRSLTLALLFVFAALALNPRVQAAYMTTVTAAPGKIMDGERVMAEVPAGTKLWVFETKPGWVEVKDPQTDKHGWISAKAVQKLNLSEAQWKQLDTAEEHYKRSTAAQRADKLDVARREMEKSYQIVLQIRGKDHPLTADTAWRLAGLLEPHDLQAHQLMLEALESSERWLGRYDTLTLEIMASLADFEMSEANYSVAKNWLALTADRCIEKHGKDSPILAAYMIRLGWLYWTEGDIANSRAILNEALAIFERHPESPRSNIALIEDYLGSMASHQGDQAGALRHHERALEINRKLYGANHSRISETLIHLGVVAGEMRDFAKAKQYYDEALAIKTRAYGAESLDAAGVKHNLGLLAAYQRDFAKARQYYNEVLPAYRRSYGNNHPNVAVLLNCLANVVRDEGDHAAARRMYEEAVAIERKAYGPEHHEVGGTLRNLAFLSFQQGNDKQALRDWHESRQLENRRVRLALPSLSPSEQMHYLNSAYRRDWFHALSFGYLRRTKQEIVDRSAEWLINGKAIAQESLAELQLATRGGKDENRTKVAAQLRDVRTKLAALANTQPKPAELVAHRAQVEQLTAEERRLAGQLAGPLRKEKTEASWYELSSLRAMLPKQALYIDIVRMPLSDLAGLKCDFAVRRPGPANYFAWIIPPAGQGEIQIIDLGTADKIDAAVENVRAALAASGNVIREQGESKAAAQLQRQLQQTADLVLRPLLPALADKQQLILSPDGALWLLPWAALPVGQDRCLLEQCSIRYALSGRDAAKDIPNSVYATKPPAIFANPDFDLTSDVALATLHKTPTTAKVEELALRGFDTHSGLPRVKPLPFTEFEGQAAKTLLPKLPRTREPRVYQQTEALEENVKALQRPLHLLFATHGFFLPDPPTIDDYLKQAKPDSLGNTALFIDNKPPLQQAVQENPLLRCGLLLSGCNSARSGGLDDGILTGLEIVGLDLRGTELVVLSACETGIGRVNNGEGVAGLRQAFQLAGAQSVVSTLWQVPDRDSALIMQDFLTNLAAKQNKAEALRNAQLKRIAARKEKSGAAHPFFWAAWTVTGDPPSGFTDRDP
jgi:CHAT domain-containing protein